jgi:hypothetical protein
LFFDDDKNPKPFKHPKGRTYKPGTRDIRALLEGCEEECFIDFVEVSPIQLTDRDVWNGTLKID